MDLTFKPAHRITGVLAVPGDKSISHRAAIFAAMAKGTCKIEGLAPGGDVASTLRCLEALGVETRRSEGSVVVEGRGWRVAGRAELDAENSGTTMRLLTGALAGVPGEYRLTGDESLSRRPMDRVAEPLRMMGARVGLSGERFPPVEVNGAPLKAITYESPVASAQVKAAVLLAGLQADGTTTVVEKHPTRDHTERMLEGLGALVTRAPGKAGVEGGALPLGPFELSVPGDFSSAAYLIVAALLVDASELAVEGVGLNPSRTGLLEVLRMMGGRLVIEPGSNKPEPSGTVRVSNPGLLTATTVEDDLIPRTIDELSLVALAATRAEGTTTVRGAAELRVKESDRIAVLTEGLRTLGADIEETPDGFSVSGPTELRGGRVDPKGDHRMALTFAVAGLAARAPVTVAGWECTRISYPGFEEDLRRLLR